MYFHFREQFINISGQTYEQFIRQHMSTYIYTQFIILLDIGSQCIKNVCFTRFDYNIYIHIIAIEVKKDNLQHGSTK